MSFSYKIDHPKGDYLIRRWGNAISMERLLPDSGKRIYISMGGESAEMIHQALGLAIEEMKPEWDGLRKQWRNEQRTDCEWQNND